jgi:hypothetical protein
VSLVVGIAVGYVLGRGLAFVGGLLASMLAKAWLRRSPDWQDRVRRTLGLERGLKATLVGPWITRRR